MLILIMISIKLPAKKTNKEIDKKCSNDPLIKKKKDVPYLIDQHLLEKKNA